MSGSVPLLLKSLAGELSIDLKRVSAHYYDNQNKFLYLGTDTGEIFSLHITTKSDNMTCTVKLFMICSLETQSFSSKVLAIGLGETPFHHLTDASPRGLVSVHADGRLRLWDVRDGRCLLCSSAGTIEAPETLISLGLTNHQTRRFVFAVDNTGQCIFIDLWGMKVHKIKESAPIPAVEALADDQTVFVVDKDEKVRVYELIGLQSKMLLEYENFLANPDEMDLVIAGHRGMPAQNAFLPVRQSQLLATETSLSITTFSDPPVGFLMGEHHVVLLYSFKTVIYLRTEVLPLGKLLPFESVRAQANEFKCIIWEWEGLDKQLVKAVWLRDGSLLLITETLETCSISIQDIDTLLGLDFDKSLNIYTPKLKTTKMRDSGTVNIIQRAAFISILGAGEKLTAPVRPGQFFIDSEDELICILMPASDQLQVYRVESPPAGIPPVFISVDDGSLSPTLANQSQGCIPKAAARFGFSKRNPTSVHESLARSIANPALKLLTEEGLQRLLEPAFTGAETVTTTCVAVLMDGDLCLLLGTSQGGVLIAPVFMNHHLDLELFWMQAEGSVNSIEVQNHTVLISCTTELVSIRFRKDDAGHREMARHQSKKEKAGIMREIASSQITRLHLSSHIERILPLVILNEAEAGTLDPTLNQFCSDTVGMCLQGGQLALLNIVQANVMFEHRCSQAAPVGIFFDKRGEYLLLLLGDGQIDVFSVAVGNISLISNLKSKLNGSSTDPDLARLAFEIKLLSAECFTYERTLWIEDLGLSGLGGRRLLEDYRETYADLRAYSRFSGHELVNLTQAGSVFQFSSQAYTDELTLSHINYAALRTQNRSFRPIPLELERQRAALEKTKQMEETGFGSMSSLKEIEGYFGGSQAQNNGQPAPLRLEQLPQKFQNLLERNWFPIARERLGDAPLKLLERIENDEQRLGNGNSGLESQDRLELVRILVTLHYSSRKVFSDPADDSNLPVLKKRYGSGRIWIICYQPPIFDPNSASKQNKLASIFLPQGIDLQAELELKAALGEPLPVVEYAVGSQGLAESFGFVLPEGFVVLNHMLKPSSSAQKRSTKSPNPLGISTGMTTSIMLSIVSELIFVLKKCYPKVPSLVAAIRALFFERAEESPNVFVPPSHLQLILSTLNDKLLMSASAHFALNNILDPLKVVGSPLSTPSLLKVLSYSWDFTKANKNYSDSDPLTILDGVSKFELFVISCMLFHSKVSVPDAHQVIRREDIVSKLAPVIEIKVAMSYPFLVVPTIKVVLETLPALKLRDHLKVIKRLFHSTVYFSFYYGLTFEPEDQENPTYVNSSLLSEDFASAKQLRAFVAGLKLQSYDLRRGIRVHILKLLKLLGETDMELTLHLINEIVSANDVTKLVAYNAIDVLKYIIKFCEADFNALIVHWAEALMKSLNPNKPEIRKFCQKMSTSALKSLLKRYAFCCFHKDSQHFFVPGSTNEIIIYDLRTAMRWKSLKGHSHKIDCLAVHDNGQTLASLSSRDKELKFWKIGASGFFENLLRSSTELIKSVKLKEEPPTGTDLKMVWLNDKTVEVTAPKLGWRVQASC